MLPIEILPKKLYEGCLLAAFREEVKVDLSQNAFDFFDGAPDEIKELANIETLQYLLDDVKGVTKPLITAALWGTWTELLSNQPMELFLENCSNIIETQLLDFAEAMEALNDKYEFHDGQEELISSLFYKKVSNEGNASIKLTKSEAIHLYGDIDECIESLAELNIYI